MVTRPFEHGDRPSQVVEHLLGVVLARPPEGEVMAGDGESGVCRRVVRTHCCLGLAQHPRRFIAFVDARECIGKHGREREPFGGLRRK